MKNTKTLIRVITLALCAIMLCSCFVGCGKEEEAVQSDTVSTSAPIEEEGEIQPVFSGKTYNNTPFTVIVRKDTANGIYESDVNVTNYTSSSTTVEKAVYERNIVVEDQLKIRFNFVAVENTKIDSEINTNVLGGETDTYDLIVHDGRSVFKDVLGGELVNWAELEYVNLDAPWWNQNARKEWTTKGGKIFAMNGDLSYMSVGSAGVLYFNRDVFNDHQNLTSPYDHVANNTWTLENFKKAIADADAAISTGDGDDNYGYCAQYWRGPIYATYCTGISTLVKDGDGNLGVGIDSERFDTAFMDYYNNVYNTSYTYRESALGKARDSFKAGKSVFFDDNLASAVNFNNSGVNFGIVPWPKYDSTVANYNSLVGSGTNTFAVPLNTSQENRVRISEVLEAMAYYGYKNVVPSYFDTVISYQAVQDNESLKMLQTIRGTLHFDLGHYVNFGKIGDVGALVCDKTYSSVSTAFTDIIPKAKMEFDVWNNLDALTDEANQE